MIIAEVANTLLYREEYRNVDRDPFSLSNLEKLRDSMVGVPICTDYEQEKHLGFVLVSFIAGNRLYVVADIETDKKYLAIGYYVPDMTARCLGAINNPIIDIGEMREL